MTRHTFSLECSLFPLGGAMHRNKIQPLFAAIFTTIQRLRIPIGFSFWFFLAGLCAAQADRSGLTGTVTDSSGRRLPQARVTAVENAAGMRREAVSDASGTY